MKEGNIDTAFQIWDKLITEIKQDGKKIWRPVTAKNLSAYHNCFVVNMLMHNGWIQYGVAVNLRFIESDFFHIFAMSVTDESYKANKIELQLLFLNQLLFVPNPQLDKLFDLLNKQTFSAKDVFFKILTQKIVEQIEQKIEVSKAKRKENKVKAKKAGQDLSELTTKDIARLKSNLGSDNPKYSSVADKLANEILQCSIDFFNFCHKNVNESSYIEVSMSLAKTAKAIAAGNLAKQRIEDTIVTLEEIKKNNLCFYCNRNIANANSSYLTSIYKETYRSPWYLKRREVRFETREVTTPRCEHCKKTHESSSEWLVALPIILFTIIGLLLGLNTWEEWFFILLVGVVIGIIISSKDQSIKASKANIKKKSAFSEYEPIRNLLNNGWTTIQPTA
ncbi:MAG: hypothetical protein ACOYMA_11545 [Bacteroidia bacterium]